MHLARLKLVGFRPRHIRSVRGTVSADITRCRGDHARRPGAGQVWRFIIRAYGVPP
jgi:hypothetical protein